MHKIMEWFARIMIRFAVWVNFDRADLRDVDVSGYFWVQVAHCSHCDRPINMDRCSCKDADNVQAALQYHLFRCQMRNNAVLTRG